MVRDAFERLAAKNDIIVMEGAGSAVELNLKEHDLVNMAMAEMAGAKCILVGDIDRGGIFAALLGSFSLLEPGERDRIIGFIVNKLRGDPRLFEDGVQILQSRSGVPVFGVVPYFENISPARRRQRCAWTANGRNEAQGRTCAIRIGVVRLPFISNYTDFDPFERDPRVDLVYFDRPAQIFGFDAVIIPGSKNTIEDLAAMRKSGMADALAAYHKTGGTVVGLCGGYQMMGTLVRDPHGIESSLETIAGLGLLDMETEMYPEKITSQVEAQRDLGIPALSGAPGGAFRIRNPHGQKHLGRGGKTSFQDRAPGRQACRYGGWAFAARWKSMGHIHSRDIR